MLQFCGSRVITNNHAANLTTLLQHHDCLVCMAEVSSNQRNIHANLASEVFGVEPAILASFERPVIDDLVPAFSVQALNQAKGTLKVVQGLSELRVQSASAVWGSSIQIIQGKSFLLQTVQQAIT